MNKATVLLIVLASSLPVAAQSTWESHTRTGEYAFAVGEMERAEQEFRAALEAAQKLPPPDLRLETSLGNLARFYENQSRFPEALPMYQLQVAAAEERLGADDPALLDPLIGLARTAMHAGDIPTAEGALLQYRSIATASGGADPGQHWVALALLARTCTLQDREDDALAYQREAVSVLDEARGVTEVERAVALESLAQMELLHGDAARAEGLLARSAVLRSEDDEGGSIARMLTAAAETAVGAGELGVAASLAERALTAAEAEGADPFPVQRVQADIAWMKVRRGSASLADLYLGASPSPELDEAYDRLLVIHGQPGKLDAAAIGENLSRLARVAALRGEVEDCAHWQRMFIDSRREIAGPTSDAVMAAQQEVIELFMAAGRTDRAITANTWLLATQEGAWGESSPRLRPTLERQLELLTETGLKKQAKQVKKRLKKL